MAVGIFDLRRAYKVLSTDTKPTNPASTRQLCYELDTGLWYAFNGTAWVAYSGV